MSVETDPRTEKRRTLVFLAMCFAIAVLAAPLRPGIVLGESMAPTFHSGQVFLSTRVSDPRAIARGDVVLLSVGNQVFLKRVYALPRDTIWALAPEGRSEEIEDIIPPTEVPRIRRVTERYRGLGDVRELTVPDRHVYVLGDSRHDSYDSRHFGPVPWEAVRAKVVVSRVFRLWGPDGEGPQVAVASERNGHRAH